MTVHEIQDDGNIKEIHKVTGGPYGGMYVNQQFETLLEELFGVQRIQKFKEQHPSDWLSLMNEFEGKKTWEAHFRRQFDDKHPLTKELCIHVK